MSRKPKQDDGPTIGEMTDRYEFMRRANVQLTEQLAAALGDERGVRAGFDVLCKALAAERAKVAVITQQNEQMQARVHSMLPKPTVTTAATADAPKPKRKYTRRQPQVADKRGKVGRPRKGARA